MVNRLRFTIPGKPMGKGRPRFATTAAGYGRPYTPEKTENYETLVKWEFHAQCGDAWFADAPLRMNLLVYMEIPRSASKRRKALMLAGKLRPTKKPDFDNIGKIVADALNGLAYHDDAQVVDARVVKLYGETPRVEVEIEELEG